MKSSIEIHNEVREPDGKRGNLCFQNISYHNENGTMDRGYRFIWRARDGSLQLTPDQTRIPNAAILERLIWQSKMEGWFR